MKYRMWAWNDEVYDIGIVLFVGDFRKTCAWVKEHLGEKTYQEFGGDDPNVSQPLGRTGWVNTDHGQGVIIWLRECDVKKYRHLAILVHETQHAAVFTLRARGLQLDPASEEAYAYFQTYLFRESYRRIAGVK